MAYISHQCVACTDATTRVAGKFGGRDEKGRRFAGNMYECDNQACPVNQLRMRRLKKAPAAQAGKASAAGHTNFVRKGASSTGHE